MVARPSPVAFNPVRKRGACATFAAQISRSRSPFSKSAKPNPMIAEFARGRTAMARQDRHVRQENNPLGRLFQIVVMRLVER